MPGPEDNEKSITCSISYNEFGGPTIVLKDSRVLDVKRTYLLHTCDLVLPSTLTPTLSCRYRCTGYFAFARSAAQLAEPDGGFGRVPGV